jgi:hypothetical protein
MATTTYTSCCIHVTGVSLDSATNAITFTLSNGNTIVTDAISLTGVNAGINLASGSVVGNDLRLVLTDASIVNVDITSLVSTYIAGTGIDITGLTVSILPLTETGGFNSLINDYANHTLKTIRSSDSSIEISASSTDVDFIINPPRQYDITADNTTTNLINRNGYYRNIIGLAGSVVILPDVTTVPFGTEYHIFAGSDLELQTTGLVAGLVPSISAPYNYASASAVSNLPMLAQEYYIVRKYSTSSFIATKQ